MCTKNNAIKISEIFKKTDHPNHEVGMDCDKFCIKREEKGYITITESLWSDKNCRLIVLKKELEDEKKKNESLKKDKKCHENEMESCSFVLDMKGSVIQQCKITQKHMKEELRELEEIITRKEQISRKQNDVRSQLSLARRTQKSNAVDLQ